MRAQPDRTLVAWLGSQSVESIWTTAVTLFEIRTGLELWVPFERRQRLETAFDERIVFFAANASGPLVHDGALRDRFLRTSLDE